MMAKPDPHPWVRKCVMLSKVMHIGFSVRPFEDFPESGMWTAEFSGAQWMGLPGTYAQYGASAEKAAEGLLEKYVERYASKASGPWRVSSAEELEAKYEFLMMGRQA